MLYRKNEPLGMSLSALTFGGAAISGEGGGYGFGSMPEVEANKLLRFSWEHGINLYDTAPIYGFGLSEERMGKFLPREAVIVTKGGVDWHANKRVNMTNDPKVIERMFYESLKRLKRDFIDVYMIHWPDPKVDIRRSMDVLVNMQDRCLVKKLGLCNSNSEELRKAQEVGTVDFLQSELNLFRPEPIELLGEDWKNKFTMSWGTLDKGILSGRVTKERQFDSDDCRSWAPWWNKKEVEKKAERVKNLKDILSDYKLNLVEFCLNYNLSYIGISSAIVGARNEKDLMEASSCLQLKVKDETIKEVLERWNKL
jgi:myo-inositol catabolism protein IolS